MIKVSDLKSVSSLITKGTTPSSIGSGFVSEGVNFVKSESISGSKYLNREVYAFIDYPTNIKLKRSQLQENDLLFSIAGAYLGKLAIVEAIDLPANTNQAVAILRVDKEKANVNYLYYYFSQIHINDYINKLSSQSSQPNLNLDLLGKLQFKNYELETQKKIAKVLSDLDAKIELNNKINSELEAMAKTLHDYWFVQFDFPDADGKPYKTSGGKMVWNEELKREIPDGWKNGQLGDVGKVSMCKRVMKHETSSNDEIPFFKISTFGGDANTYISRDLFELYREKYSYPKRGDILISAAGTIGKIVIFDGESSYFQDSNIVWIDNDESKIPNCFLFYYYQTEPWVATGGSTIKRLYNDNIRSLKTIFPNSEILKQFSHIINPRLEKKQQIESENKKLSSLRDWLLPMLMNGQVRVGDVEEELGMVAESGAKYEIQNSGK
jgi:type I restriction enzyme S subunit